MWPESGAMAALEAANKKPVMSPYMNKQVRSACLWPVHTWLNEHLQTMTETWSVR